MEEVILTLNGVIDSYGWFRYQVEDFLRRNKDKAVRIQLDSYGGDVGEALAISRLLENHGNVTVEFMGVVASAATWMAFGAKSIETHQDTLWLCHKCSVSVRQWANLKAEQVENLIKQLRSQQKSAEVIDLTIAQKYLERCGEKKTLQDVLDLMSEERYITAADCEEWGFVDKVIPGYNKSDRASIANCLANFHLPPIPEQNAPKPQGGKDNAPGTEGMDSNFFSRLGSFLQDFFRPNPTPAVRNAAPAAEPAHEPTQTQSISFDMTNKFPFINALLGVAALTAAADNSVSLTQEQLQTIEDALKENQRAIDALNGLSDTVKNIDGLANKVNAVKLLVDRIPTGMAGTSGPTNVTDENPLDSADLNDPANEFAKKIYKRKK